MEKPKVVIVGVGNEKSKCIAAIEAMEHLGFETLVVDPHTTPMTPKETMLKLEVMGTLYDAKALYNVKPKSKYHK